MANAKISVAHLLDHGWSASSAVSSRPVVMLEPEEAALPVVVNEHVMATAKKVTVMDRVHVDLTKSVLAAKTPREFAELMINARYAAHGGAGGWLGAVTSPLQPCPDGIGFHRLYKSGAIYWHPGTGAHEVHGAIRQKWLTLGAERSFLGYPRTDEKVGTDPKKEGRYNHFQGGSIYWHPATGAFEVHGAILAKYVELGAEASVLGYPTTDETATPDTVGRFNHFQRGSIYWTPATGAHEVHGLIRQFWAQHGWERNAQLGYPVSDELVPHRRIGATPAPWLRKPLDHLPADVLRLPDEQPPPSLRVVAVAKPIATTSTAAKRVSTASTTVRAASTTRVATTTRPVTPAVAATVKLGATDVLVAQPLVVLNPSILFIDHQGRSQDRYGDFENGVLFWRRATNAVTQLKPRTTAPGGGGKLGWTAADIVALVHAQVKKALGTFPGATLGNGSFAGTTAYSYDGAGVHNRAHRVRLPLQGTRRVGATTVAATTTIEVEGEVSFDPVDRQVVLYLARWRLVSSPGDFHGGGDLRRNLQTRLDPALWQHHVIVKIPNPKDDPVAVLSVKTHADGGVGCYFEL